MLELEWVEIPEGSFQFGLSAEQFAQVRQRLWTEFGLDKLDAEKRALTESVIEKFRRMMRDEPGFHLAKSLTPEERTAVPWFFAVPSDPRLGYFWAEAQLEVTPSEETVWLPTYYITRYPLTHGHIAPFLASEAGQPFTSPPNVPRASLETYCDYPVTIYVKLAEALAEWFGARLPTAMEWEKAARGTDGRLYPWGNEWDDWRGNFGKFEYLPDESKRASYWTTVNSYPGGVSPYGLWGMIGDLSELTIRESLNPDSNKVYRMKGFGRKDLDHPLWFWGIAALSYSLSSFRTCLRLVKTHL